MSCIACGYYPCACPISWPQATGPSCTCPTAWWGIYPPPCPVHNPPYPTQTPVRLVPYASSLSDADIERIARRLKQLLDAGKSEP